MMYAWSFAARDVDEVARLLRAAGKHRYVRETDHRIHWAIDAALAPELPAFAEHARRFAGRRADEPDLEIASRDPSLWRPATVDEVIAALTAFWTPDEAAERHATRLAVLLAETGLPPPEHEPFESAPDSPPHPELVLCDWVLYSVDELDTDRHAGALAAMEEAAEPVNAPSAPVHQEGPVIAVPELVLGAENGLLPDDFVLWSEEPYAYADYVFRGVAKSAKLVDPPVGYRDL